MTKVKTATPQEVGAGDSLYELMLILSPDLRESEIKKKLKELTDMIEKADGRVVTEDFWGRRNLAYRLKRHNEGIYMVYNLELPGAFLKELKQHLRIEKEVLRSMIIKLPAGHAYTKYDLDAPVELKERKEKPKKYSTKNENISIKHNAPIIAPKKKAEEVKEETEEVKEEMSAEEPEKKEKAGKDKKAEPKREEKEIDESELDKKLDAIIGGEDFNL
ncbi:30S ribosomal protein S6 [Candidatus Peregrinibacteria bacterium]|nr:30S ribosomal protein S6 [Candidatus Peregrinibacteria bacterium]